MVFYSKTEFLGAKTQKIRWTFEKGFWNTRGLLLRLAKFFLLAAFYSGERFSFV
jgi:hypothetical protein